MIEPTECICIRTARHARSISIGATNVARAYRDGEGYGITAAGIAPHPSNPALEPMELAGVSPQWLTQWRFQYRENAETLAHE